MYQESSQNFGDAIAGPNRDFKARLVQNDIVIADNLKSLEIIAGNEEISLGTAVSSYIQGIIDSTELSLSGKEVMLQIGLLTDEDYEFIPMGKFTIQNPKLESNKISFTAYDGLTSKCNGAYYSKLLYPTDVLNVLEEIESMTGVIIDKTGLSGGIQISKRAVVNEAEDDESVITSYVNPFDGYTYKEAIGFIAGLFGKFAVCGRTGNIEFRWYTDIDYSINSSIFYSDLQETEENFVLGKIICNSSEATFTSGSGTTGIEFTNPIMTQTILDSVMNQIGGLSYTPATIRFIGDMRIDIGDIVTAVKNDGTEFKVPIISLQTSYDGGLMQTIASYGNTVEEDESNTKGPVTEILERVSYELAFVKTLMLDNFTATNGTVKNLSGDFANFKIGEFESLKSKQANFETTTTENFTAVNAELESVKGDFASFKTGEFEELKAKSAELETAVIGKADITDLDALRTRTGTLEADYSKLNTLVNGNLTSENIQNLNLTSLNTTIENGMIKNAMIESLAFDKITGIDINTTKMTVHSDDGKSTWTDNTIQIADAKRVRVQIGKDAEGDYNIYIWDKDGNLMFDPLYGVQESGIKRAIIRDDMVSDNANIKGSKLDIEDVIKEVNGAETAINGTRIKLDEQNQTLDVAFSSLKTYAEEVNSKTETNVTAITVAQGQISSLISNTTIVKDGKTVQLKDAYNSTVSDVNSMKTTIGEHTSLLDEQSGEILAVQTKANTIESDLNGTKQTISAVQSDLASTKSRVTTVETGLDGMKTRVANTETALTKKADGTTVDTLTNRVATCETTLDGFEVSLSETNKTVSDNYTSLADEIEETNATVATHTEQISSHDTRITAAENSISLKVSTSDFNSYKTTVTDDIDTAKNAAINAAASDATTKANNAKSSAISTAAADAKTKADKALADSKSYTNAQVATVNESLSETNQEINVMKGQIALKVEQKDIDTVVQNIDNKFASYSTTTQMNSAINLAKDSITQNVSAKYVTKTDLSSSINEINASLELKINKDTLISEINASADVIALTGNRFVVDSDNFKLTADGTVTANNVNLTGTFTANSGMVDDVTGETVEFNTNVGSKGIILERKSDKSKYTSIDNSSIIIDGGNVDQSIANVNFSPRIQLRYTLGEVAYSTNIRYNSINLSENDNDNIFAQSNGMIGAIKYTFSNAAYTINYITCTSYNNLYNNYYSAEGYHAFYCGGTGIAYVNSEGISMGGYDIKFNLGHGIKYGSSEWILRPYTSGDYNVTALGNTSRRTVLYGSQVRLNGSTGTTVSSDRRLKKDFADFDERYEKFFMDLKPQMFRMAYTKCEEEYKITNGFIAQDVEEALNHAEINPTELDLISCETADKEFLSEMYNGNPPEIEKQYTLNYSGFISLNTYMIQKTRKEMLYQAGKIDLHETIIQDLQNRIYQLEKQIKELRQAVA